MQAPVTGPLLAVDFSRSGLRLLIKSEGAEWRSLQTVPLNTDDLVSQMAEARTQCVEHAGAGFSTLLLLPSDEVHPVTIPATTANSTPAYAEALEAAGIRARDVFVARASEDTLLVAATPVVVEAFDFAHDYGLNPVGISAIGLEGIDILPEFVPAELPKPRKLVWSAASVAACAGVLAVGLNLFGMDSFAEATPEAIAGLGTEGPQMVLAQPDIDPLGPNPFQAATAETTEYLEIKADGQTASPSSAVLFGGLPAGSASSSSRQPAQFYAGRSAADDLDTLPETPKNSQSVIDTPEAEQIAQAVIGEAAPENTLDDGTEVDPTLLLLLQQSQAAQAESAQDDTPEETAPAVDPSPEEAPEGAPATTPAPAPEPVAVTAPQVEAVPEAAPVEPALEDTIPASPATPEPVVEPAPEEITPEAEVTPAVAEEPQVEAAPEPEPVTPEAVSPEPEQAPQPDLDTHDPTEDGAFDHVDPEAVEGEEILIAEDEVEGEPAEEPLQEPETDNSVADLLAEVEAEADTTPPDANVVAEAEAAPRNPIDAPPLRPASFVKKHSRESGAPVEMARPDMRSPAFVRKAQLVRQAQEATRKAKEEAAARALMDEKLRPTTTLVQERSTDYNALDLTHLSVLGVFSSGSSIRAILRRPDGTNVRVTVNTIIDGWRVVSIDARTVNLQRGGEISTLPVP